MSFIDDSEKNIKYIKEQTGGSVAGFVGRSGMGVDALFAGPFHPDSGHGSQNKQLLQKQLKDRREQRKDIESDRDDILDDYSGIPDPVGGYYAGVEDEGITLAYDELDFLNHVKQSYSDENTPLADIEWKSTGWDYEFDEFDSSTGRDRRNRMFDKDFINQSEENTERTIKEEEIQLNEQDFITRSKINLQTVYKNDIGLSISMGN